MPPYPQERNEYSMEHEKEKSVKLTKDQIIMELLTLLNESQQKETAYKVFEMAAMIDGMDRKLTEVTEELQGVRQQLEKMEKEKADKTLKAIVRKAADFLEQQCHKMKEQLFEIKTEIRAKSSEIVEETKAKGKAALNRVSEFFGIKDKLESVRSDIHNSIGQTEQTIQKIDFFGGGMREAGETIANTFRTFADKEAVDYSAKEKKFSKTELLKKPFVEKKKLFEIMEGYLDAAIDRVERLAVKPERAWKAEKNESVTLGMVAEQEYQYGAEAFETQYREFMSRIMKEQGKDAVAKGKRR